MGQESTESISSCTVPDLPLLLEHTKEERGSLLTTNAVLKWDYVECQLFNEFINYYLYQTLNRLNNVFIYINYLIA